MSLRIKICGLTTLEDARHAEACGAHALGFIFYPSSPRRAEPEAVAAIVRELHPYTVNEGNKPPEFADLKSYTSYLLYDLGVDGLFTNNPDIFPREAPASAG